MFCNVSFGGILSEVLKKFEKTSTGCVKGDCENGDGTFTWADGQKYVGEWKEDQYHGQGIHYYGDGRSDKGIWKNNELVERN